ncbi:MAG: bifunctional nicotinamidase/pyrazinamidase [Longimicrobiales bacterium]|nr:bifunctional nicotinamidase/pyrazinamidase [Longimicrobiales bacterium]
MTENRPAESSSMRLPHVALVVVDIQPDFLPGGALAVEGGDEILARVARLMAAESFELIVATQDWHPPDHVSFASHHPGHEPMEIIELHGYDQTLWPDHCIQGTPGAHLVDGLPWDHVDAFIRKGTDPEADSYSAFRNNWNREGDRPATGLGGYLREREIEDVWICGLARDVCVRWTAEDAVEAGFRTTVLWDLTRSVDPSNDEVLRRDLTAKGVQTVNLWDYVEE